MNSTYYIDPELFTVSPMADIGAVMQVSEASFLYMTISNTTYVWRNIMFQLCMISLNMLQLEIFQCFNGGLLRFRWFHSENIKYMRITSLIIHIICGWSSYLQGLAFPYEEGSIFAKWSPIGAAVYSVIICGIGLSQNMLILIRFAETFLFERIVNQFRKRAGSAGAGSNSQSGRTGLVSSSNVKTTGMSAGGGSPTTASSPTPFFRPVVAHWHIPGLHPPNVCNCQQRPIRRGQMVTPGGFAQVARLYRETASSLSAQAQVELAHWAHQLQVSREDILASASTSGEDPLALLDGFDLLTHASVGGMHASSAMPSMYSGGADPIPHAVHIGNQPDASRDVVWDETHEADTDIGTFEILSTDFAPPPKDTVRCEPVSSLLWAEWFDLPVAGEAAASTPPIPSHPMPASSLGRLRIHKDSVRCEAWKFLYGIYSWESTLAERKSTLAAKRQKYEDLKALWMHRLDTPNDSKASIKITENDDLLENIARIGRILALRCNIYLVCSATNFCYPSALSAYLYTEKDVIRTDRTHNFYAYTETGSNSSPSKSDTHSHIPRDKESALGDSRNLYPGGEILLGNLKKLSNLLTTYVTIPENDGIGFVQGMADLASPFLVVMQGNEADAFWCFVTLMESMKSNFTKEGTGMRSNLNTMELLLRVMDPGLHIHLKVIGALSMIFCFRWFLVLFKREFEFKDVLRLWEVCASNRYTYNNLQLFVSMAILDEHRDVIVRHLLTFDEILKYVNDVSMNIRLDKLLIRTEQLFQRFTRIAMSRGCISENDMDSSEGAPGQDDLGPLRVPVQSILERLVIQSETPNSFLSNSPVSCYDSPF
ncbi:hypothetical protein BSLG_009174 [Batrachochytrium salamandrivorans]|nr:hypothetical protein BSLG_009174 [Batrachochytrium salamandrivorans]